MLVVLDVTVLVYAVGSYARLRETCRAILEPVDAGHLDATTTPEVIQRFVRIRATRWGSGDAAALGRAYTDLLAPLLTVTQEDLVRGLRRYTERPDLLPGDAVLAAVADNAGATLVSADRTFARLDSPPWVYPDDEGLVQLLQARRGPGPPGRGDN